jgi:hypothetical protein
LRQADLCTARTTCPLDFPFVGSGSTPAGRNYRCALAKDEELVAGCVYFRWSMIFPENRFPLFRIIL